ncbi:Uncharacterized protein Fot_28766 [Forsythia ovata]|uniref:Uncharacterized protein n=1 Tax=Forsythia ovata TaxID=205694 RepID=A0ABD1TPY4_9LAMI
MAYAKHKQLAEAMVELTKAKEQIARLGAPTCADPKEAASKTASRNLRDKMRGEMGNHGQGAGIEGDMRNDGEAAEGVGIQTEGAYVPQFIEHTDCNIEPEWKAFLDRHQDQIWNHWKYELG